MDLHEVHVLHGLFWSMVHKPIPKKSMEKNTGIVRTDLVCGRLSLSSLPVLSLLSALSTLCSVQQSTAPWQERTERTSPSICDWPTCFQNTWKYPTATSENPKFCSQSDQPTLQQLQHKTEKQKMKKKIEQNWMNDQKKQILSEEEAEFEELEEVEREAGYFKSIVWKFPAVIIAKGLPDKSMESMDQRFSPQSMDNHILVLCAYLFGFVH